MTMRCNNYCPVCGVLVKWENPHDCDPKLLARIEAGFKAEVTKIENCTEKRKTWGERFTDGNFIQELE